MVLCNDWVYRYIMVTLSPLLIVGFMVALVGLDLLPVRGWLLRLWYRWGQPGVGYMPWVAFLLFGSPPDLGCLVVFYCCPSTPLYKYGHMRSLGNSLFPF